VARALADGDTRGLGSRGKKHLLIIPIAFVTEHIETLHEINIEAREEVEKARRRTVRDDAAVGDSSRFIATLADLVLRAAVSKRRPDACQMSSRGSQPNRLDTGPARCI